MLTNNQWVVIDAILYLLMTLPFFFCIKYQKPEYHFHNKYNHSLFLFIGILLFCLYDKTSGDYFHYQEYVYDVFRSKDYAAGFEDVYVLIVKILNGRYVLFRLTVWGSAFILYVFLIKYLKIDILVALFSFLLVALVNFSYPRVSLALVLFYVGYIFLLNSSIRYKFIGILLLFVSSFFHKSIFVLYPILMLSFFPLKKWMLIALLFSFPICVYIMNSSVGLLLEVELSNAELHYLSHEKENMGSARILSTCLQWGPICFFLYSFIKRFVLTNDTSLPKYIPFLTKLCFWILYISSVLAFLEIGHGAISYRIRNMVLLPISILMAYALQGKRFYKRSFIGLTVLLAYNVYHFLYMYYLKSLGLGI